MSLSERQLAQLDAVAEHDGRTRSEAIRRAVIAHLARLKERPQPFTPCPKRASGAGRWPRQVPADLTPALVAELDVVAGTRIGGSRSKTIRDAVVAHVARYLQMNPDVVVPDAVEAGSEEVAA